MKEKKKKDYEVPLIRLLQVETESGFCNASIGDVPEDTDSVIIEEQAPGVQIGGTGDGWDDSGKWNNNWD